MSSQLIALEVLFIVGLLTIFIGLPWHLVYQRRIKLGKPLLDQWSSEESTLDLLDVVLTFFCYFGGYENTETKHVSMGTIPWIPVSV